jgi:hypothetical protein
LKITAKNQFYNMESDEFTTHNTTGSDGLIRNNQERLFTTFKSDKVAFQLALYSSINLLKPAEHCL